MDGNTSPARARQRFTSETGRAAKRAQQPYQRGPTLRGLGKRQLAVLKHIMLNPGACGADIDRATNVMSGKHGHAHAVTYDCINRLTTRGIITGVREAFRIRLYIADEISVDDIATLLDEPTEQ